MASASDRWPKYRAAWDERRPAWQVRRPGGSVPDQLRVPYLRGAVAADQAHGVADA